jgi:hypothetical protein
MGRRKLLVDVAHSMHPWVLYNKRRENGKKEDALCRFVIEDALRGNDRKPTDIICFLSTKFPPTPRLLDSLFFCSLLLFLAPENI